MDHGVHALGRSRSLLGSRPLMRVFRVELHGSGFRLSLNGRVGRYEFIATRVVSADSADGASQAARRLCTRSANTVVPSTKSAWDAMGRLSRRDDVRAVPSRPQRAPPRAHRLSGRVAPAREGPRVSGRAMTALATFAGHRDGTIRTALSRRPSPFGTAREASIRSPTGSIRPFRPRT